MIGIATGVMAVLLLGSTFIGLEASERPAFQKWGPWLVGAIACIASTIVVSTYDRDLSSLDHPVTRPRLVELLLTTSVMAILASEAVVISRWSMKTQASKPAYLLVFVCTTVVVWFFTLLVLSFVVPGS